MGFNVMKLDKRSIATAARQFAKDSGEAVGARGRLSVDIFTDYLMTQPQTVRGLANALDIPVSQRGRVSKETILEIAASIR
jgi:hypothetical protein